MWSTIMSTKEDRIQARIEPELKRSAEAIFNKIGISSGEAIRMFYSQVKLRGGIPFDVRIPNKHTTKAMDELNAGQGERFNSTDELFDSWEE
jgi:DNA-damage-inducible protein J